MPRQSALPATSRAARFHPYFWALQDAGVNIESKLAKARIPSIALYEKDTFVSCETFGALICQTAREEGIEDIAAMGAEMAGCSARSLQRKLHSCGLSYSKLLDQARVDVAQNLLAKKETPVIEVGFEVGFEDPAHFSRCFKRLTGITPSQYRTSTNQTPREAAYS